MANALHIIKRDHWALKTDYKKFQGVPTFEEKKHMAEIVFNALDAHGSMEEEYFYPVIQKEGNPKARRIIEKALEEHAEMKKLISRCRSEVDEFSFQMKIDELFAGVMHHMKEEESKLFPEVEKSV